MRLFHTITGPLDEFSIVFYNYWIINKFNISLTTLFLNLIILNLFFFYLIFPFNKYFFPTNFQFIKEQCYINLVKFMFDKNPSVRSIKFFIFYFNLFFFIL